MDHFVAVVWEAYETPEIVGVFSDLQAAQDRAAIEMEKEYPFADGCYVVHWIEGTYVTRYDLKPGGLWTGER